MTMLRPVCFAATVVLVIATVLPATGHAASDEEIVAAIESVMQAAEDAWNTGDIPAYMACYWRSPELRFAGGDRVSYGWQQVLAGYERAYPDQAAMGTLTFSELDISVLADDAAICFGRWRLQRTIDATPDDNPRGVFTLVLRLIDGQWRIVHDHTSAAD